jgi:hypothetical protein
LCSPLLSFSSLPLSLPLVFSVAAADRQGEEGALGPAGARSRSCKKKRKESQQSGLTGKRKENRPLLAIKGHGCQGVRNFLIFSKPNFILSQFTHVTSKTNKWVEKWIRLDELYALVVSGHPSDKPFKKSIFDFFYNARSTTLV